MGCAGCEAKPKGRPGAAEDGAGMNQGSRPAGGHWIKGMVCVRAKHFLDGDDLLGGCVQEEQQC